MLQEPIHDLTQTWGSGASQSDADTKTYRALAVAAKRELSCNTVGLYVIDPASGIYRGMAVVGDVGVPWSLPGLPPHTAPDHRSTVESLLVEEVKNPQKGGTLSPFHQSRGGTHVFGVRYKQTPYSFVVAYDAVDPAPRDADSVTAIAELAFLTFANRAAHAALHAGQRPLDITLPEDSFYDGLRRFIVEATGMELVILRIRGESGTAESRNLRGVVVNGWDEPLDRFDLIDYSRFSIFEQAVKAKKPLFRPDPSDAEVQAIWAEHPHLKVFESFALFPIVDDQGYVMAVLTIGSKCRLDLVPAMEAIVKGAAQTVGFTLRNRDLHFERTELQANAIETAAALTAVEVYADLNHQIGNAMAAIPEVIEAVDTIAKKGRDITANELQGQLDTLEESHDLISALIDQAASMSSVADDYLQPVSVRDAWNDAKSLVDFRLSNHKIQASCSGDIVIDAYPLQLRQVFFHLLLNSVNAFASRGRRQHRRIELHINRPKDPAGPCLIRYTDNAGGINPASLRRRGNHSTVDHSMPVEQAIFARGVTSRKNGTGNGLWVVRQILQRHYGGINLASYKENVVFDIELPTQLREQAARRRDS